MSGGVTAGMILAAICALGTNLGWWIKLVLGARLATGLAGTIAVAAAVTGVCAAACLTPEPEPPSPRALGAVMA